MTINQILDKFSEMTIDEMTPALATKREALIQLKRNRQDGTIHIQNADEIIDMIQRAKLDHKARAHRQTDTEQAVVY